MGTATFSTDFLESVREEEDRLRAEAARLRLAAADHQRLAGELATQAGALEGRLRELEAIAAAAQGGLPEPVPQALQGREIWEAAVSALIRSRELPAEIHYRSWFELLVKEGRAIVGKDPLATFLTQIGRSPLVSRVPGKPGHYRLDLDEASQRISQARRIADNGYHAAGSDAERSIRRRAREKAQRELDEVARWRAIAQTPGPVLTVVRAANR